MTPIENQIQFTHRHGMFDTFETHFRHCILSEPSHNSLLHWMNNCTVDDNNFRT